MQPPASSNPVPPIRSAPYPGGPSAYGHTWPSPYAGHVASYPPPYAPARPRIGLPRPTAVAPVPGTHYGVVLVEVRPTASGPAVASLVAGIASIIVSTVVLMFASAGAADGWGPAVAGAFAALAAMLGAAAVGLATAGLRGIRASAAWGPTRGRGVGIAGLICGVIGLGVTALTMLIAVAAAAG